MGASCREMVGSDGHGHDHDNDTLSLSLEICSDFRVFRLVVVVPGGVIHCRGPFHPIDTFAHWKSLLFYNSRLGLVPETYLFYKYLWRPLFAA